MVNEMHASKRLRHTLAGLLIPAVVAASAILIAAGASSAETYPNKPIKVVLPSAAGSPIDAMARLAAIALSSRLGQPVIIENRAGGGGTNYPKYAHTDPTTEQPVSNGARNLWVTETSLSTALYLAYTASAISLFGLVVGIALLLSGIGFLILALSGAIEHVPFRKKAG